MPFRNYILVVQIGTMKCFYRPQRDASLVLWDSPPPPPIKFFRRTSTLMLVKGQFATWVSFLHTQCGLSATMLQAPYHQPTGEPPIWVELEDREELPALTQDSDSD